MKCENTPSEVSELVPFSPALRSTYDSRIPETRFVGISKNGLWIWIVTDTSINIYHTENSDWLGGYCFGESLKNPSAKISAVTEFCSSHISYQCLLIAVSHDDETIICMYDVNVSKVMRSILIPDTVLSLEVISGNGGASKDTHHLFIQLRYLFGIVALGTSKGHLYFLDLSLDEDFICDENLPNITFILNKYELLPERREKAILKNQHIFMLLNDQSTHNGTFELESRSSSLSYFPLGKVHVNALKYIQSTVTLAIGFNFGGIQLWDLTDLCLLYTVANQAHELPIVAFEFQEPENDPRNFCYLWIIRGHSANYRPEDFTIAAMYSLTYSKKTYVESYGNLYTDLQSVCKRFEYPLTRDPFTSAQSSSTKGSCIVSCQTICQTDESHLEASSANDSDTARENMSLCFLSWLVWTESGNSPASHHLAVFDLNQWYQAQMPFSNFKSDPSHLNPYFAHFSLEEVVQNFDLEPFLGLHVKPHSIKKFKYISPSEEFFYPSSLDFQAIAYSTNGICKATFLGIQKSLLYEIGDMGSNVLSNPKEFYSDLIHCGLVLDAHGSSDRIPLIIQRETILQLALEYHLPYFFMKCLNEWKYAESIQEGCTSRALLNWSWKKVMQIKSSIDKLNLPFFNCSGTDVDQASLKCLYSYRRQLDLIDSIFMGYQKFAAPRTEQGIQELKCRKNVVSSISMYLQVVLWLRLVHVLPEVCEGEETGRNILYPVNVLVSSYFKRRNDLQKIHSSICPTDILLIDGLVKEAFTENSWQEKGGNGIYPPPSVYAAISCYLIDGVHVELKHTLMYYLLLDMCYTPHNAKNHLLKELKKFPIVFGMSQSISKLVKAFWYLDQGRFEAAIKKLLHPAVKASDILPWQHQRVIKSFLFQREPLKALKYINHLDPPENTIEDMKLHLSVLLSQGAITQAFHYQRSKQTKGVGTELLNHLFLGCQETRRLKDLMYLPLNFLESSGLVKFLSENEDIRAQEALVMYYLLRCNFFEAAKISEKLTLSITGKSVSSQERAVGREALVEGFLASVPQTEKNLVEEINRFPSLPVRKGESLQPLSLSVKSAPLKEISYSDILNSLLSGASSAMCAPYLEPKTPLKSVSRSYFNSIPFLRPPLTPEHTRFPEAVYSTPVAKRTLVSPSSEFSSPTKKSRLLDNATFKTSSLIKKKIPKHLAGDVASLLQSPPIHRRSSARVNESIVRDSPCVPPQGILKRTVESTSVPVSDRYSSRTPSVLSEAEESEDDDLDEEKMIVADEDAEDIPGRLIRFRDPPKEEVNVSIVSASDAESSIFSTKSEPLVSNEPSDFMKKLDELKSIPLLDPFESGDHRFRNVSQRRAILNLTREPLKIHSEDISNERLQAPGSLPESAIIIDSSNSSSATTESVSQLKATASSERVVDISDFDDIPIVEVEAVSASEDVPIQEESKSINPQFLKETLPCTMPPGFDLEAGWRPILHLSSAESFHNKSGSSSGNSSYNSASERSLHITPRRPLRDNSRNASTSDLSIVSAGDKKDDTMIGSSAEKCEDDADICIVEYVNFPPKAIEPVEKKTTEIEVYDITEDIPVLSKLSMPSVKDLIDEQIERSIAAEYKGDVSNVSSDIVSVQSVEEIVYSKKPNSTLEPDKVNYYLDSESEDTVDSTNKSISSEVDKNNFAGCITSKSDHVSESSTAVQESTTNIKVYDFSEDIPKSSLPAYVPIKERITRSYMGRTENIGDFDDISFSSSSSKDRTEQPGQDEAFKVDNPDFENLKFAIKSSVQILESDTESCGATEEDKPQEEMSLESKTDSPTSAQKFPQNVTERFDFLSRNSTVYESSKLYKEAMHLLQGSDIVDNYELYSGRNPTTKKSRTFVFTKSKVDLLPKIEETASKSEDSNSKTGDEASKKKEFLESWNAESYEQFSHSIQQGNPDADAIKNLKSSPSLDVGSTSIFGESYLSKQPASDSKTKQKKQESVKKDTSLIRKTKSAVKKSKGKGKVAKKMEFSFAEPHSPAGPEILEALTTTPENPIGTFMFSPPLTRGRLRQKRLDETLGSSFCSVMSETSFAGKKPPVDPILEGIMAERTAEPKKLNDSALKTLKSKTRSSTKKKSSSRNPNSTLPHNESMDTSHNLSRLQMDEDINVSPGKVLSSMKFTPKHRMVLRQTKTKKEPRKEPLF